MTQSEEDAIRQRLLQKGELDPRIWDNPTLGEAAHNVNLEVLEAQQIENRRAEIEGRKPEVMHRDDRYPGYPTHGVYTPKSMVESISDVRAGSTFSDGAPVKISQAGTGMAPVSSENTQAAPESRKAPGK